MDKGTNPLGSWLALGPEKHRQRPCGTVFSAKLGRLKLTSDSVDWPTSMTRIYSCTKIIQSQKVSPRTRGSSLLSTTMEPTRGSVLKEKGLSSARLVGFSVRPQGKWSKPGEKKTFAVPELRSINYVSGASETQCLDR